MLHVINKVSPSGGAEVSLVQLLPRLARRGLNQTLLTLARNSDRDGVAELRSAGVDVVETVAPSRVAAVRTVRATIHRTRPQVVHSCLFEADLAARLATRGTSVPAIVSIVNTSYSAAATEGARTGWKLRAVRLTDRLLAHHCTEAFHAISDAAAMDAASALGVPLARFTVIPRGRDRSRLRPRSGQREATRASLGLPADAFVVLNVARQEPQKGQVHLVRALPHLRELEPRAHLVIAGRPGAASADLAAAVASGNHGGHVSVVGLRSDVPDLLAAADVFAFSSLWEGLGGALLEAMAAGVPIVAFDIPAVRETVGAAGVLVPPGDDEAFGRALGVLAGDDGRRVELAAQGQRRFAAGHDLDVVADRTVAMYRSIAVRETLAPADHP